MSRAGRLAVPVAVGMALLSACGSRSAGIDRPGADQKLTLSVRSTPDLGRFLVNRGWTLYMYPPDRQRRVTCTKVEACKTAWPPLFVAAGRSVIAGPGVKPGLIGTIRGDGGRVVTYNHWPLYYYIGDRQPEVVNGQDQGFNWFVIGPNGLPTKTDLRSSTG